jgi:hypothetical protein
MKCAENSYFLPISRQENFNIHDQNLSVKFVAFIF